MPTVSTALAATFFNFQIPTFKRINWYNQFFRVYWFKLAWGK